MCVTREALEAANKIVLRARRYKGRRARSLEALAHAVCEGGVPPEVVTTEEFRGVRKCRRRSH